MAKTKIVHTGPDSAYTNMTANRRDLFSSMNGAANVTRNTTKMKLESWLQKRNRSLEFEPKQKMEHKVNIHPQMSIFKSNISRRILNMDIMVKKEGEEDVDGHSYTSMANTLDNFNL